MLRPIRKGKKEMVYISPTEVVLSVSFANPDEGPVATADRLIRAAVYTDVSHPALRTLILLTGFAHGSDQVVSMSAERDQLEELVYEKFISRAEGNTVVLL